MKKNDFGDLWYKEKDKGPILKTLDLVNKIIKVHPRVNNDVRNCLISECNTVITSLKAL